MQHLIIHQFVYELNYWIFSGKKENNLLCNEDYKNGSRTNKYSGDMM